MTQNRGRLTSQQLRILSLAWFVVILLVGACVFLAVYFGPDQLGGQAAETTPTLPLGTGSTPTPLTAPTGQPAATTQPGEVEPSQGPTPLPVNDPSFGYGIQVQAHANTEQTLDQVKQLGLHWIKQQISWKDLEAVKGQPNWDALDKIFKKTSERNIKVLISVTNAPDWARSVNAPDKHGPPDDPQDLVNYITLILQRYPGAIHAVEVWNEPNLYDRGWYAPGGVNAQGYIDLLIPSVQAIRQIDPGIIIVSAALAPTGVNQADIGIDDFIYLQQLVDLGLLDQVDCVGAHSNGINMPPDVPYDSGYQDPSARYQGPFVNPNHSWSFYSTLNGYHEIIVASGHDTPLCVTEFGWPAVEGLQGEPLADFSFAYDNSPQEQAEYIVTAFQLMHDWDFVWLAFLFNLDYASKGTADLKVNDSALWSITGQDGVPRPAYDAVRDMPKPP
jgi:polysaccharide biosynthesis protein PslG